MTQKVTKHIYLFCITTQRENFNDLMTSLRQMTPLSHLLRLALEHCVKVRGLTATSIARRKIENKHQFFQFSQGEQNMNEEKCFVEVAKLNEHNFPRIANDGQKMSLFAASTRLFS